MRCTMCRQKLSIRHGSILFKAKITLKQFLYLSYLWSVNIPCEQLSLTLNLSRPTVIKYTKMFRRTCGWQLIRSDLRLGGVGRIVQIDESVIYHPKYHRGHALFENQKCIFGMFDTTTKMGVIQFVPNRSAATLLPIIQRFILPGTEFTQISGLLIAELPIFPSIHPIFIIQLITHFILLIQHLEFIQITLNHTILEQHQEKI